VLASGKQHASEPHGEDRQKEAERAARTAVTTTPGRVAARRISGAELGLGDADVEDTLVVRVTEAEFGA
jgi:hypothetical protein